MKYGTVTLQPLFEEEAFPLSDLPSRVIAWGWHELTQESVWVVAFDATLIVRAVVPIAQGNQFSVQVDMAALLTGVLASGTNRFWVIHNHPSTDVTPTERDLELTAQINVAAAICGMYLEDHIVIGRANRWYSMVEHGQLEISKGIERLVAQSAHQRVWTLPHGRKR